jgi:hypothetical protein
MARPKKTEKEKLRHAITLRLDDELWAGAKWYEKNFGVPLTTQARMAFLKFLRDEGYFTRRRLKRLEEKADQELEKVNK